ncbi:hypothetical protein OH781_17170 [Streptomyces sp. NBC_01550]|uniref:hypothetical protein n=1 Tax=unclassified Streptomyces TaxID=2593676 RepID=UPI003865B673|nr:hypothetical protein OG987_17910 [Streptomyces sp. NBC_01620]
MTAKRTDRRARKRTRCCGRGGSSKPGARPQDALDADGPDAGLHAVLGRSHAAEDADDEDDLAERVHRRGPAEFPDDLDLLAACAELCLSRWTTALCR